MKSRLSSRYAVITLLIALNALLLMSILWARYQKPVQSDGAANTTTIDSHSIMAEESTMILSADSLPMTTQAPLFSKTRRPILEFETQRPAESTVQDSTGTIPQLLGIIITNEGKHALLGTNDTLSWVTEGGDYDGWHIAAINPVDVELKGINQEITLHLYKP